MLLYTTILHYTRYVLKYCIDKVNIQPHHVRIQMRNVVILCFFLTTELAGLLWILSSAMVNLQYTCRAPEHLPSLTIFMYTYNDRVCVCVHIFSNSHIISNMKINFYTYFMIFDISFVIMTLFCSISTRNIHIILHMYINVICYVNPFIYLMYCIYKYHIIS